MFFSRDKFQLPLSHLIGGALDGLGSDSVADLIRVGLLVPEKKAGGRALHATDDALALFLPLLKTWNTRLVPMERSGCPISFCTGIVKPQPQASRPGHTLPPPIPAGGQGVTVSSAAISCIGEMAERVSLFRQDNDDKRFIFIEVDQPQVELCGLLGFSRSQEKKIAANLVFIREGLEAMRQPAWHAFSDSMVRVRLLGSDRFAGIPAYMALFNEEARSVTGLPGLASSIGCAVWRDREGARDRALLELAERDAVAQMWYNRLGITSLAREYLAELLAPDLADFVFSGARNRALFSIDTDLPVHVVMALSWGEGGLAAAFGACARRDLVSACNGAIGEMLQSENSLGLMEKAYPRSGSAENAGTRLPRQLRYARYRSITDDLPLLEAPRMPEAQGRQIFPEEALLQACLDRGFDVWEFDATRPDLQIPCIKLFSPDLCTWEPRFGRKRLYQGVVDRGLRSAPASEAEFAARPFPF